ncbi:MAG: HD domain-containing protein [Lachnospiraceae bacterium]|nr:HD domain-containing protein [Lachnospiraceae bacterium]
MRVVSEIMKKMIEYSDGSNHDINHFMKVHNYARTIGELEGLAADTQMVLEVAAIVHDIACPMLRQQFGVADGKKQEVEGMPLAKDLLKDTGLSDDQIERVVYLVGHHHTIDEIDGMDYQILIEADYLVNADESSYSKEKIRNVYESVFKTETGKRLLAAVYGLV